MRNRRAAASRASRRPAVVRVRGLFGWRACRKFARVRLRSVPRGRLCAFARGALECEDEADHLVV